MSLTITQTPSLHSFSKELIAVKLQAGGYLQQTGAKAVNRLFFSGFPANTAYFTIKYGSQSIKITAVTTVDDSGTQIPAGQSSVLPILEALKNNYLLNRDFILSDLGDTIIFQAREIGATYNMTMGLSNTSAYFYEPITEGRNEIAKPNYTVLFSLFLENAENTAFDLIYTANLQLHFDAPGVAIAQIGDKLHQKISADLDLLGLEIPNTSPLACKTTCRKYYFQYAESFGEPIAVQKITTSSIYHVLYGGLSYQAQNNKTVATILNPSTPVFDRFLKQGLSAQYTQEDQPQLLYFYNARIDYFGAKLMVKRVFNDASEDIAVLYSVNLVLGKKYGFNISYGSVYSTTNTMAQYQVYLVDNGGSRISEIQTYIVDHRLVSFPRYFLNLSSWGTLDCRLFTGKNTSSFAIAYDSADKFPTNGYSLIAGTSVVFNKKLKTKFKIATGYKSIEEIKQNKDFFLSDHQYRFIKNSILPIEVTSSEVDEIADGLFLYAQTFEYHYLFDDEFYTDSDLEDAQISNGSNRPQPIGPIIIYAGTPANPSFNIVQQQLP